MATISLCCFMTGFYSFIYEHINAQSFFLLLLSVFFSFLLITNVHYAKQFCDVFLITSATTDFEKYDFDYSMKRGPKYWKDIFPAASGCYQSPINIIAPGSTILRIQERLIWNHYDELPLEVMINNTGHTVELKAKFACNTPTMSGADLLESYSFVSLCFRWSLLDDEGSEHLINNKKYPVELQASHVSRDTVNMECRQADLGILIISYFFSITRNDNPYLDPIVENLYKIQQPGTCVEIPPFPLSWLCFPFRTNFYSYGGSLTEPPCSEGVTWFIHPDPMAISVKQIAQFRSLISKNGVSRILKNSRPVQNINSRVVCYNKYDECEDNNIIDDDTD